MTALMNTQRIKSWHKPKASDYRSIVSVDFNRHCVDPDRQLLKHDATKSNATRERANTGKTETKSKQRKKSPSSLKQIPLASCRFLLCAFGPGPHLRASC